MNKRNELWVNGYRFRRIDLSKFESSDLFTVKFAYGHVNKHQTVEEMVRTFGIDSVYGCLNVTEQFDFDITLEQARQKITRLRKSAEKAGFVKLKT